MAKPSDASSKLAPGSGVGGSRAFLAYLLATSAICGALVMVIELLGSRVIGPFFGVSLFVWTSLITVTLISLAAGYAAGGVLADRRGSPGVLYAIIGLAGALVLLIPLFKAHVLRSTISLGLRAGAFGSALLLFGPPLFCLGCVSPLLIRIAAGEVKTLGRTVGLFSAVSTVGSFLGTVLTGFFLIVFFGVNKVFLVVGALLLGVSAGYGLLFRRRGFAGVLLALPLALGPPGQATSKVLANGTTVTRVFGQDTYYGSLRVVDYSFGAQRHRDLINDGAVQGGIDVASGLALYEYFYFMELLPFGMFPRGKNCLVLGMGAGLIPRWYEQRGVSTDVVEIDPHIVSIARDYFGFAVTGEVIIEDARYYLNKSRKRYDYVVLDVFNGDTTPGHLLSLEALKLIREHMSDSGILAINLIGSLGRESFMTASVARTLEQVFRTVKLYPIFDPKEGEGAGNIAVLAYDAAHPPYDPSTASAEAVHPMAAQGLRTYLGKEFHLPKSAPAIVLTDDYNPFDFYDVRLKEWMRRRILSLIDADILI